MVRHPTLAGQAYFGVTRVQVDEDGLAKQDGVHVELVSILVGGTAPYECTSN